MKTLFLITKQYPFGNYEQYITYELTILSNKFDKIYIYPNDYYEDSTDHDKILPHNAEILHLNAQLSQLSKNKWKDYLYLLKQCIREGLITDDKRNFFKNFKWNLVNFWTQYQLAQLFRGYLQQHAYNSTNAVFYSYWFHKSAILLSILKDKGVIHGFVARAHSVDLYHHKWGMVSKDLKVPPFKMFKLTHATRIYAVSEHGRQFLLQNFPTYRHKISTGYLGVQAQQSIAANGVHLESSFHIVTCSTVDSNKRIHRLAQVLSLCNTRIHWTHFGGGVLLKEVEHYQQLFPAHITADLKGNVSNSEVIKFYQTNQVDLFVNLSVVEGLPVSIMEALSFGIPVLATSIYGTPEAVKDGYNGRLIPVDFTNEQLTEQLIFCIGHKEVMEEYSRNAKKIYEENFNADKNYSKFANQLMQF
jgi:glycosyltransferase involved in cell wall biosynthesis